MAHPEQWQPNITTTKAQVSGHRFFQRRVALGLVIGDERLIHDPLSRRNRAMIIGLIAVVLLAVGAGLLAIIRPEPTIGDSVLIQDDYGQLYVLYEEQWHPVSNLTSARLLLEAPQEPTPVAAQVLADLDMAPPLGISDAPQIFSSDQSVAVFDHPWLGCVEQQASHPRHADAAAAILVGSIPNDTLQLLDEQQAVLVPSGEGDYILSVQDEAIVRRKLPDTSTSTGRILRDYLGVTTSTPRWVAPPVLLALIPEQPEFAWPEQGMIVSKQDRSWFISGDKSQLLTPLQKELLLATGGYETQSTAEPPQQMAVADLLRLPEDTWEFQATAGQIWCVRATATAETKTEVQNFSQGADLPNIAFTMGFGQLTEPVVRTQVGTVEQARLGENQRIKGQRGQTQAGAAQEIPLYYFHRTKQQAIPSITRLAITGSGYHVLSETGVRHRIDEVTTAGVMGIAAITIVPWELIQLLPQGSLLSSQQAAVQLAGNSSDIED